MTVAVGATHASFAFSGTLPSKAIIVRWSSFPSPAAGPTAFSSDDVVSAGVADAPGGTVVDRARACVEGPRETATRGGALRKSATPPRRSRALMLSTERAVGRSLARRAS